MSCVALAVSSRFCSSLIVDRCNEGYSLGEKRVTNLPLSAIISTSYEPILPQKTKDLIAIAGVRSV